VGAAIYYPLPLHLQECFKDLGYRTGDLPVTEQAAAEVLSIPIYPELTARQKDYVIETIKSYY
jgi:dTDP-4-amino-4,6-dideoxygalactose transaminase